MFQHGGPGSVAADAVSVCAASPALRSVTSHAQDRSRSPAHGPTSGLPLHHPLAAVAEVAVANASGATAVPEDRSWYTTDTILDCWVLKSIASPQVRAGLAVLPCGERKQIILSCMKSEHSVRNLTNYFVGCIRKSLAAAEFRKSQTPSTLPPTAHSVAQMARPLMKTASPQCAEASSRAPAPPPASAADAPSFAAPKGSSEPVLEPAPMPSTAASAHNDASALAPWARTCMQHIGRKSMLLRAFCQLLDADAVADLQALPPTEASHVVIACCLAWEEPMPVSTLCRRLVRNYGELQQSQPSPSIPPQASHSVNLVILHLGGMGGVGHISMKAAFALVLKDMPTAKVSIFAMHVFAVGARLSAVEKAAAATLGVRCTVWSSADDFVNVCSEHAVSWGAKDCRVLVLMNWDAVQTASSVDAASRGDAAGPAEPIAVRMSSIQQSLEGLQAHVPVKHLGVMCMHRMGASAADEECLKSMLGAQHSVSCEGYSVPQLPWSVFASPLVQSIIGHSQGVGWPLQAAGWHWAGDTGVSAASSTSAKLTVDIFDIIDAQVFAERELSPAEHGQLQLVTMTNAELGTSRLIDRSMLLRMLGVAEFSLGALWDTEFPCLEVISSSTGQSVLAGTAGGVPCGSQRWCLHCEFVFGMLLSTPNAALLTDVCCAWLRNSLKGWVFHS